VKQTSHYSESKCIKSIKSYGKSCQIVAKKKIKQILSFWIFYSSKNPENKVYNGFHKNMKQQHDCFQHW